MPSRTRTHKHARTHAHTHTPCLAYFLSLSLSSSRSSSHSLPLIERSENHRTQREGVWEREGVCVCVCLRKRERQESHYDCVPRFWPAPHAFSSYCPARIFLYFLLRLCVREVERECVREWKRERNVKLRCCPKARRSHADTLSLSLSLFHSRQISSCVFAMIVSVRECECVFVYVCVCERESEMSSRLTSSSFFFHPHLLSRPESVLSCCHPTLSLSLSLSRFSLSHAWQLT